MKIIKSRGPEIFDIELEKDILAKNRNLAGEIKKRFDRSRILAIDIMGSIGAERTSLIEKTLSDTFPFKIALNVIRSKLRLKKGGNVFLEEFKW